MSYHDIDKYWIEKVNSVFTPLEASQWKDIRAALHRSAPTIPFDEVCKKVIETQTVRNLRPAHFVNSALALKAKARYVGFGSETDSSPSYEVVHFDTGAVVFTGTQQKCYDYVSSNPDTYPREQLEYRMEYSESELEAINKGIRFVHGEHVAKKLGLDLDDPAKAVENSREVYRQVMQGNLTGRIMGVDLKIPEKTSAPAEPEKKPYTPKPIPQEILDDNPPLTRQEIIFLD
jgi:hypothetical protein